MKLLVLALASGISMGVMALDKIDRLEIVRNEKMQGSFLSGAFEVRKLLGLKKYRFEIPIGENKSSIDIKDTKIRRGLLALEFSSDNNVPAQYGPGKVKLLGRVRKGKLDRMLALFEGEKPLNGKKPKKLKKLFDCSNVIQLHQEGEVARLDMSQFNGLFDCKIAGDSQLDFEEIGLRNVAAGSNFYSESDDVTMGQEFVSQYLAQNARSILADDHPMTLFLQDMMNRIAGASDTRRFTPKVYVINADVLNAFALPGGSIFVFRGLIERSPNEAALAGVLAHEWAHVAARHGTKGVTRQIKLILGAIGTRLVLYTIAAILSSNDTKDDAWAEVILPLIGDLTIVGAQLQILHGSRVNEFEADRLGSQYAYKAGYAPYGLALMFEEFKKMGGDSTSLEEILSTHPDHDSRINQVVNISRFFLPEERNYIEAYTPEFRDAFVALTGVVLPIGKEANVSVAKGLIGSVDKLVHEELQKQIGDSYPQYKPAQ